MQVAQVGTVPHLACQHEYTGRLLPATPYNAAPLPQLLLRLQLVLVYVVGEKPVAALAQLGWCWCCLDCQRTLQLQVQAPI